jgi:hypothetical protein
MLPDRDRPKPPDWKVSRNPLASGPTEPCLRCGVRADVGCKHRPAEGRPPPAMDPRSAKPKRDGRSKPSVSQGFNFRHVSQAEVDAAAGGLFTQKDEA